MAILEHTMSPPRIARDSIRSGLLLLLLLQCIQMMCALRMLEDPDAFIVSPFLWAAIAFKCLLMLLNAVLLWLAHRATSPATASTNPSPNALWRIAVNNHASNRSAIKPYSFAAALLIAAGHAHALDPACETYLRAAEKSAGQTARHSISETEGLRLELIHVGGHTYTKMSGEKWKRMKNNSTLAAERKLVASMRSGEYPISACRKLGSESIDGTATTVYAYTLKIPGLPNSGGETKAYIGADGLVHGQSTTDAKVRHRYRGVTAPSL
jgi:hypothetical protein